VIDCGSCGGGGCFVAGTLVTMADGALVPIERVHSGDAVRSFDPAGGVVTTAHVTAALKHEAGTYPDGIVRVNGSLLATGNHPFFANGGRVRADQLAVGASIVTLGPAGKPQTDQVRSVESRPAGVPVFDLRVDGPGTFFAGGIVVLLKD
jgi:hypothetical protein